MERLREQRTKILRVDLHLDTGLLPVSLNSEQLPPPLGKCTLALGKTWDNCPALDRISFENTLLYLQVVRTL